MQQFFDVEGDDATTEEVRPSPKAGIMIGGSTRSFGASRHSSRMPASTLPTRTPSKRRRATWAPPSTSPIAEGFWLCVL